jgi:hypothetical protein
MADYLYSIYTGDLSFDPCYDENSKIIKCSRKELSEFADRIAEEVTKDKDVDEEKLRSTTNPKIWAEEFSKICPAVDIGLMTGWFANCAQNVEDHLKRELVEQPKKPKKQIIYRLFTDKDNLIHYWDSTTTMHRNEIESSEHFDRWLTEEITIEI